MRMLRSRSSLAVVVVAACSVMAVDAASADAVTITKVALASAPEFTAVSVKIKGSGFSTEPGATTIRFGGEPATSVDCTSSKLCIAVTPFLALGTVPVTATVGENTSSGSVTFESTSFAPPVVELVRTNSGIGFAKRKLTDAYPAIFTPGNVYLQIYNGTSVPHTFTGPTGSVTLEAGSSEGYNIPVDESSPYLFELTGVGTNSKKTLSVKTKNPK